MQDAPSPAGQASAITRLAPLLILVPAAAGLVVSFARLLQTVHPVYGWSMSINADAEAMYLGIWPFGDPAAGFTGDAYTPLFAAFVSVLHRMHLWTGWPIVVTLLSGGGIAAMIASLAYRAPARRTPAARLLATVEAAGIGALAVSFVFGLLRNSFYEARPDHFTWLLAFAGILLVPRAARGGIGAKAAVVALLTAAFWAKQTALIASITFCGLLVVLVAGERIRLAVAVGWAGALLLLNALILLGLDLATDGWQYRFNFEISLPATRSIGDVAPDALARAAPALALLTGFAALAWAAGGRPRLRGASDRSIAAIGLAMMALLGGAAGLYLRRFAGGDDNNLIPCVWALGGLCALAYRGAGARRASAVGAAILVVVAFASTFAPGDGRWRLRGGDFVPEHSWADLPADVESLASRTLLWDPLLSDLNVAHQRVIEPNSLHIQEALLRNARPRAFEHTLLGRRFGGIFGLSSEAGDLGGVKGVNWEDGYFWKINQVVLLKYMPARGLPRLPAGEPYSSLEPSTLRVPRPGPDPAAWVDSCFAPFQLMGREFRIHRGGGLWCVAPPGVVGMRGTPARLTELVSSAGLSRVRGTLRASLAARRGGWRVELDGGWTLRAVVSSPGTGVTISAAAPGRRPQTAVIDRAALHRSQGRIDLVLRPAADIRLRRSAANELQIALPVPKKPGKLHFWATRDSDAKFNLKELSAE